MYKKVLLLGLLISGAHAHTAVMTCFDNGDDSITCEGGFSNGASGSGVSMYIQQNDQKIITGIMNEDSEFSFKKPTGKYKVHFDAGEGHMVVINGKDIIQ